jgi:outer membrane protein TolC
MPDPAPHTPLLRASTRLAATTLATALALATTPLRAEPAPPVLPAEFSLPAALRMANRHNPAINIARARIREADGALAVTESSRRPDLAAFGTYYEEEDDRSGSFGGPFSPDPETWRYGVEVIQPLFSGGQLAASVAAQRRRTDALRHEVAAAELRILAEVCRAFYDARLARETVALRQESLTLLERQLEVARNRYDAGAGAKFDVLQAEVRVANARPPLIRAANDARITIDELRALLGADFAPGQHPDDITLTGDWTPTPPAETLDLAIAQAMESRSELLAATSRRRAAEEEIRKARRKRAPRIDFFANYTIENERFDPAVDELSGWQAGVQARLEIWDGGNIGGQVAQAEAQRLQSIWNEEGERLAISREVRTAWSRADEAREILDASDLVIAQAEEALRLAANRFAVGSLTQLDVLASELDLTTAKLDRLTAARDVSVAVIDLYRSIGRVPENLPPAEPTQENEETP